MAEGSRASSTKHENGSNYMMGHSASEAERLDRQHIFFRHVVDGHLLSPALGSAIQSGQIRRVLDIGTGTGIWCHEAAATLKEMDVPAPVKFVGIDIAENEHWKGHEDAYATVHFQVTDLNDEVGMSKLTEQFGQFDLINSRMMISAVPNGKWAAYIRRMFNLLRPGGYVQLFEADMINSNTGRSDDRTVAEALVITHAIYSGMGLDPETAVRLAGWLHQAGFTWVRDVAYWCNPVTRQADGSLKIDDILYQWHSTAYGVLKPLFLKVRTSPQYSRFLEKLPPQAINNLGGTSADALLANEADYEDFTRRHEAVLTSNPLYRTAFRLVIAQRPQ
ncbi:hypothetical protein M409DRAFT_19663 [Zasmidium cellare ATCC 36951]|uniref:Methyltransferase domain-containing protein n=1 Tax=Zasmidium cellare ATCC 36951 TaxID=1080233 RepID=A0A6A6CSC0_ZASCE|nr:uncharacterized protein M409DRAFT_19663 [Zasmidium cellare ATCC 36951]KAF2170054.1 hypothetical protein M409DRAFT_19663 [Zasmidium cellare ATCC 36951]